jgi:predicted esterase
MTLPSDFDVTDGDPSKPIILLLHGMAGDKNHMVAPGATTHNHNWQAAFAPPRELGWSWYPRVGPYSFELDPLKNVTSWRERLQQQGYRTAAYSQIDPTGLLARPVQELAEVIDYIRNRYPSAKLVLLAHSRGGLLARKFLKDNATNTARVGAIIGVITLHSPHGGSILANVANDLNAEILAIEATNPGTYLMLDWLRAEVNSPSFLELARGSPFLTDLQRGEQPLPNVKYVTFGGTSVLYSRLLVWSYSGISAIAQWHWPPFYVVIYQDQVPWVSPLITGPLCRAALSNVLPYAFELFEGTGDLLVTDAAAKLPFAAHRTNALNHAEALWDPGLQNQALQALNSIYLSQGPVAQGDDMQPGEVLNPNQSITSANGRYTLIYQGDGNLVLYDNSSGKALWASNTAGRPAGVCIMQGDGNLVIYTVTGEVLWASNTSGYPGSRLLLQNDGNVVIYRPDGKAAWATNTWLPQGPIARGDDMQPGEVLNPYQSITSANGRYTLIYQGDGNLVLYDSSGKALWASNTAGGPVGVCIMQGDGNLVIYAHGGKPVWSTNTWQYPGSHLIVQNDGNVVIYRPDGTKVWATNTGHLATLPQGPAGEGDHMQPGEILNSTSSAKFNSI